MIAMLFTSPLLLLCAVAIPLLAGAAGIVLFVVGLVKKKPALWGSGIALGVTSLVAVTVGIGMVMWTGFRTARTMSRQTMVRARTALAEVVADMDGNAAFQTCTDLTLPESAKVTYFDSFTGPPPAGQSLYFFQVRASEGMTEFLTAHFAEISWADARDVMTGDETRMITSWSLPDGKTMRCYRRTHRDKPDDRGRTVTHVAYDPNAGIAYVVGVQEWDE